MWVTRVDSAKAVNLADARTLQIEGVDADASVVAKWTDDDEGIVAFVGTRRECAQFINGITARMNAPTVVGAP